MGEHSKCPGGAFRAATVNRESGVQSVSTGDGAKMNPNGTATVCACPSHGESRPLILSGRLRDGGENYLKRVSQETGFEFGHARAYGERLLHCVKRTR